MAGGSSGLFESYPPVVKKRCKALKQLSNATAKLESAMAKEVAVLESVSIFLPPKIEVAA
jgi:hypothetical protein